MPVPCHYVNQVEIWPVVTKPEQFIGSFQAAKSQDRRAALSAGKKAYVDNNQAKNTVSPVKSY